MSQSLSPTQMSHNSSSADTEMFYGLCNKEPTCGNRVTCFKFKSRNHAYLCSLFSLMCTALLVAVIVPLVNIFNFFFDFSLISILPIHRLSTDFWTIQSTNKSLLILLVLLITNHGKRMRLEVERK